MFHGQYELLTAFASGPSFEADLLRAKADYFNRTGEVFEDDRSFESRMASFLEFYLFDFLLPEPGVTPAQLYADQQLPLLTGGPQSTVAAFTRTHHSLFEVLGISENGVRIVDLFTDKESQVHERRTLAGLSNGDVIEARLIPLDGRPLFSQAFCYHPRASKPNIVAEIRRQRRSPSPSWGPRDVMFHAAHMALKVERYRNIRVEDIYNFERKAA